MNNVYLPQIATIEKVIQMSPTVKLFRLVLSEPFASNDKKLRFIPGQFVLVGKIGYGESPFGPLSSAYQKKYIEVAVRKTGVVTNYLHTLEKGDRVTVRGPYGNGFPLRFLEGKDIVMATGGCGIPPIAALTEYIIDNGEKFGRVYILYGAKSPEEILMKDKIKEWQKCGVKVITTIDSPTPGWNGPVGFVTDLVKEIQIDEANAAAVMCGPGPMMSALEKIFRPLGISDKRTFVNMERKMQCGIGKCQHCTCGKKYVCKDGPVFNYDEIDKNWD